MAEGLLKHALESRSIQGVKVTSTGTWGLDGSPATEYAVTAAGSSGVLLDEHRAATFSSASAEKADLILAMTSVHLREAEEMAPGTSERTRLLKELAFIQPQELPAGAPPEERLRTLLAAPRPEYLRAMDLDDPMGLPLAVYERCRDQIQAGVDRLMELVFEDRPTAIPSP